MPVPKKRHSQSRSDRHHANWKLDLPSIATCSHCGAPTLSHQVCPVCGTYKGRAVLKIKAKKEKKESKG